MTSLLDKPITLRQVMPTNGRESIAMTFEAYMALPRGLHASRVYDGESREREGYIFSGSQAPTGHAFACYAKWLKETPPARGDEMEGGRVQYEHYIVTIDGVPLLLKPITGYGRFAVAEGPHEGVEVEYAG